jgi:hypothetical protein
MVNKCIDVVSFDSDWQFPAITEQHAYKKVMELCPYREGIVYFAFPWATLIDLIDNKKPRAVVLMKELNDSLCKLSTYSVVITVCQHIRMLKHKELFINAGITDVFWSHSSKDTKSFGVNEKVKIRPFPLYPTQIRPQKENNINKPFLYSFVGAKANQWYLTESRNHILKHLSNKEGVLVKGRDTWHYNDVVYKQQVHGVKISDDNIKDKSNKTEEYLDILEQSKYSLCPSGSGPNSIRLWESIEMGIVPIILSDTHLLPGNINLWKSATLSCTEDEKSVKDLHEKILKNYTDDGYLSHLDSLKQLKFLYGREIFVTDVISLVVGYSAVLFKPFLFDELDNHKVERNMRNYNILLMSITSGILTKRVTTQEVNHLFSTSDVTEIEVMDYCNPKVRDIYKKVKLSSRRKDRA